jgi:hypothetical protein
MFLALANGLAPDRGMKSNEMLWKATSDVAAGAATADSFSTILHVPVKIILKSYCPVILSLKIGQPRLASRTF